jgi:hypothetical protein
LWDMYPRPPSVSIPLFLQQKKESAATPLPEAMVWTLCKHRKSRLVEHVPDVCFQAVKHMRITRNRANLNIHLAKRLTGGKYVA